MTRRLTLALVALAFTALTSACGHTAGAGGGSASPCEACLASGGTWQPEAAACTSGCGLQDISCFKDACPAACDAHNCGGCFDTSACEAAGCAWQFEGEAAWCVSR